MKTPRSIDTAVIHTGEPRIDGAVSIPIFQSAMFLTPQGGDSAYHDVRYIRLNNTPNHFALADKLAALENAEAALVTSSGMAAISTAIFTVVNSGDHMLIQDCVYGGTHNMLTDDFEGFGIEYDTIDGADPSSWEAKLRPNTKAIYIETISNPLMGVTDIDAAAEFAKAHGLVSMIDNTFASPVNFRPAEHGIDISLHSATKYLNGHSDLVAGAVIGRRDLVERIKHKLDHLGGTLDPHACYLLHRGIKTLPLRVRRQNENALAIARFLDEHPAVARVNYPGLESNPEHERAARHLDGFGGMLSFELEGGDTAAEKLMGAVTIPLIAPSLGSVESLLTRPAKTSHAGMSAADRASLGISDGLIRMSVGIEDAGELIEDLRAAL